MLTDVERAKRHREKRRREGYVLLQMWVHRSKLERIRQFAKQEDDVRKRMP